MRKFKLEDLTVHDVVSSIGVSIGSLLIAEIECVDGKYSISMFQQDCFNFNSEEDCLEYLLAELNREPVAEPN
jgi:hypothetical protein